MQFIPFSAPRWCPTFSWLWHISRGFGSEDTVDVPASGADCGRWPEFNAADADEASQSRRQWRLWRVLLLVLFHIYYYP